MICQRDVAGGVVAANNSVWNGTCVAKDSAYNGAVWNRWIRHGADVADLLNVTDTRALICMETAVCTKLTDIESVIWLQALEFNAFSHE